MDILKIVEQRKGTYAGEVIFDEGQVQHGVEAARELVEAHPLTQRLGEFDLKSSDGAVIAYRVQTQDGIPNEPIFALYVQP